MEKSIIIIGGGLTGLATGCYGRMNGYKTSIYEMHKIAGGVCTGWKRKGYTIDGAMNWLVGTNPKNNFYKLWEELGAAQKWQVFNHDLYSIREDKDGTAFNSYTDADRFDEYTLKISPEDVKVIKEFTDGIRSLSNMVMPIEKPEELYSFFDKMKMVKMLPLLGGMKKWGKVSTGDFARRCKNPLLRKIFSAAEDFPMLVILTMFAWLNSKSAGYVIGGSLELVGYIQRRYLDLGGEIHFKSKVEKILVENDKAVGIRLADGTEHRADWVVSASDGHTTIFDMLDGKYIDNTIKDLYDNPRLFTPLVYIGLGIARKFDDVPPSVEGLTFPIEEPITIAGKEHKEITVLIYNFDPTLAPEDKTVVKVQFDTDYDYWEKLYKEPEKYKAEKDKIADMVVARLDKRFPGLAAQVEMRDVATPVTWVRYTGNWRGSYEGWMISSFDETISKTLPGLDNFYMAGQWVNPGGGMPTAAMSGNHTIQLICKKDGKKFITSKP